jgi:membrane fusion protein (multidrug efflux system)
MVARTLLVLFILLALVGGLAFFKYRQIQGEIAMFSQPMPAPTVEIAEVKAVAWEPTLEAIGSVTAIQGVEVNNEVAGQVTWIGFESGAMVERGQILARLADDVDRADLEGLEAAAQLAQIKVDRNRSLLKDRAVAQGDFDELSAQLDQARAQVKSKQAMIQKKAIRAPFDGQLGIRLINLGQFLPEGSPIVSLQSLEQVYVDFVLPERHLARLKTGQRVLVRVSAYPEQQFAGVIEAISPGIDQGTRNVQVRARLPNPDLHLRPGMFARVSTLLPVEDAVLTVPREAITFNTYGDSVFVVEDHDGTAKVERRQVSTGGVRDDVVAILDGLAAGERVVRAGQVKLSNGQEVRIVDAQAGAAGTGTDAGPSPRDGDDE